MANKSPRVEILSSSTTSLPAGSSSRYKGIAVFLFIVTLFIGAGFLLLSNTGLVAAGSSQEGDSHQDSSFLGSFLGTQASNQTVDEVVASDVQNLATQIEAAAIEDPNGQVGAVYDATGSISVTVGTTNTQAVALSDGVHVTVTPGAFPGSYVIQGWHDDGEQYLLQTPLIYDSANGGIL